MAKIRINGKIWKRAAGESNISEQSASKRVKLQPYPPESSEDNWTSGRGTPSDNQADDDDGDDDTTRIRFSTKQLAELESIRSICLKQLANDPISILNPTLEKELNQTLMLAITLGYDPSGLHVQAEWEAFKTASDSMLDVFCKSCEWKPIIEDLKVLHVFRYAGIYKYERSKHSMENDLSPNHKRELMLHDPDSCLNFPRPFWEKFALEIQERTATGNP